MYIYICVCGTNILTDRLVSTDKRVNLPNSFQNMTFSLEFNIIQPRPETIIDQNF
jgi:hypothetical protein